jgi:NADP-dependent 3-hydroxy acid dehydrogenase YdfG
MKNHGIKDKVVVITGASSGIGEATAVMLAERGAKVVLGARGLDRLQSLARRIERAGGEVAYAQTDVRKREDLTSLVNLACERYGQLDVLINNAGIGPISPLEDLRVDDWENMIDIEVFSTASPQRCRCFVSRVSDISPSTAGISVNPNMAVYAGTKFAVRAISEGLRQEAGDKLRVTIISPGFVNTNFTESMTSPEIKGQIRDSMDKMGISPDAIARAMVFAIEQPADVDVGEIIVRPTAQS